jgi:UDP-N-acetylmuramoyl-L-alanyl-D-glutamate--2,6-diaminopimelate ligase
VTDGQKASGTRPEHLDAVVLEVLAEWLAERDPSLRTSGDLSVPVSGISLSSQRIQPGDLYAALPGARAHGADYLADARAAGAVAVLTDPAGAESVTDLPALVVDRPRDVLGVLAARLYGDPATSMRLIGVTGTQGKTTTTRMAEIGLSGAGIVSAVVGTVGTRVGGVDLKTSLTTPEAPDLHGLFARMREVGVRACAMEVSSHALVMGRVDGVVFDVAVFTNLGRDHLDFHRDLDDYFAAKASLFTPERARLGLVNVDDEWGRKLLGLATIPMRTFSITGDADWRATDLELGADGSRFRVHAPDGTSYDAAVPLPGDFNVANALAAIGTLRPLTEGRILVVLGAGGDRDPGKRPIMGEIAARLADVLIVTDDNPRSEDPAAIRAAVLAGARGPGATEEIGDRAEAIRTAIARAEPGDVVLIAGKGHETGQDVAGEVLPFDDREQARAALAALRGVSGS